MLVIILLLSFTSLSQIDTNKICFDYQTVQNISRELIRYDSLSIELEYTQNLLAISNNKLENNSQIIDLLLYKETNYQTIIGSYKTKESYHLNREKDLLKINNDLINQNKKLKTGLIISSTTTAILGGILAIFIIK